MKNLIKHSTYFSLLMLLITSCIEEVTPPQIEDAEQKIVVNGLIAPSLEQINVKVSLAENAFGFVPHSQSNNISNAEVTISNGTSEVPLLYDSDMLQYSIDAALFPISEGVTYRIDVVTDKGTVYGETTVPNRIEELASVVLNPDNTIDVSWVDIPDESNYYRVVAEGEVDEEFGYSESFYFDTDEFITDVNRDGELLSSRGAGYIFGADYVAVTARIITCSKNYFDYYKILSVYVDEDPFADPVRLPSNIEGGLGIFTSVQVTEFTIEQ